MKFDDLDRLMRPYETAYDFCVPMGNHIVVRLDGRGFPRLTKDIWQFDAPFDPRFRDLMTQTVAHLMQCGFNILYGFTQSDEISLLFHPADDTFARKTRKLTSVLAGEASACFTHQHGQMATFDALGAFSKRMDDPQRASRPFDRDRDGLIPSGGAAALVLEDYDHAVARGATILCEVVGYGFSSNGGGISQPSDEGSVTAMTRALNDANLSPADIDYVNAHATSTLQGDMFEAIALDRLFGQHMPWISSTKGMTGHECWMAGASEVVYSILMMQGGFVAPNINFENPDEHSAKLRLATHRIDTQVNTVLSNSFGFGGTNSALIIKK